MNDSFGEGKIALFDKALVVALASGALAMCLQMGKVTNQFHYTS